MAQESCKMGNLPPPRQSGHSGFLEWVYAPAEAEQSTEDESNGSELEIGAALACLLSDL